VVSVYREGATAHNTVFVYKEGGGGYNYFLPMSYTSTHPPPLSPHQKYGHEITSRCPSPIDGVNIVQLGKMYTLNKNMYSPVARCEYFNSAGTIHLVSLTIEFDTRYSLLVDTQHHTNKFEIALFF
jgi:hypothetical protein